MGFLHACIWHWRAQGVTHLGKGGPGRQDCSHKHLPPPLKKPNFNQCSTMCPRFTSTHSTSKFHLNIFQCSAEGDVTPSAVTYGKDCIFQGFEEQWFDFSIVLPLLGFSRGLEVMYCIKLSQMLQMILVQWGYSCPFCHTGGYGPWNGDFNCNIGGTSCSRDRTCINSSAKSTEIIGTDNGWWQLTSAVWFGQEDKITQTTKSFAQALCCQ